MYISFDVIFMYGMINVILFLAYEIWFYLLLITSIKLLLVLLLLLYISWVPVYN
jgi:hypothetical protein